MCFRSGCTASAGSKRDRNGKPKEIRRYAAPDAADLAREAKVLSLLRERFADWQREGFIPSKAIPESGTKPRSLFASAAGRTGTIYLRHGSC
jgi:hypothetical protein